MAKTMNLKLTQTGSSKNFNTDGNTSGNSMNKNYSVKVVEDNIEVGNASFSFNINYYGDVSKGDYATAQQALETKIEEAIKALDTALKA